MALINDHKLINAVNGHTITSPRIPLDEVPVSELPDLSEPVLESSVPPIRLVEDTNSGSMTPPVEVDQGRNTLADVVWYRTPAHQPAVLPAWVTHRSELQHLTRWVRAWVWHRARYHAVRIPKYTLRAATYLPRGVRRSIAAWFRWVIDHEGHELRKHLATNKDAPAYLALARHRDTRVKPRALGTLATAGVAGISVVMLWFTMPPADIAIGLVVGALLVWVGRPVDKPFLLDTFTVTSSAPVKLTADVIARALAALGIPELRKTIENHALAFTAPITRDGAGWRTELDLPHGVTAVDVIEKRRELSSGLRRPMGCVWPEPVEEEHSGHLTLWVGDRTLAKSPATPYPLLESGGTDMFGPLPFGVDQRGKPQTVCLMFASAAIGAQPRMGKTFGVRLLALAAALDPSCELHIYDGKGMGDYVMFEPVAHTFLSGSREETLLLLRDDLLALKDEVDRRAVLLTKLTREGKCREGKISPELSKITTYRLFPITVVLDECHLAFDTGSGKDGKLGEEIAGLAEYLVRVGPAAGVSLVASTQRPDAKSLPSGIRANVQIRYCLRVADQPTNDMVLGTGAYKTGVRATEFGLLDKGIGYLSGEGAEPVIVRTYYVDADQARLIVTRARAAREAAGTLSGMAAGIEPVRESTTTDLLTDVLAAMGADDKCWSEAICGRLAEANPRYTGWDATTLAKALKPLGVITEQTWWTSPTGKAANRNGLRREQITNALAAIQEKTV